MSGFTKLVPEIVQSSIWNEAAEIRIMWITMLAIKDSDGYVRGDARTLARIANVSIESSEAALRLFQDPDVNSHTSDNDGRRIEPYAGGWLVLNHDKYRCKEQEIRDQTRQRVKKHREKHNVTLCNVTETLPSASASVSVSSSEGMQGEVDPHKPVDADELQTFKGAVSFLKIHPAFASVPDMAIQNALRDFSAYKAHWPKMLREFQTDNAGVEVLKYPPCQALRIAMERYIKFKNVKSPHQSL